MFLDFAFNVKSLSETLPVMGKGMLGIFAVTGLILICMSLLERFTSSKNNV